MPLRKAPGQGRLHFGLAFRALRENGFTIREIEDWLEVSDSVQPEEVVELVLHWRRVGFDAATAASYCTLDDWDPVEARIWHQRGFTAIQATYCRDRIRRQYAAMCVIEGRGVPPSSVRAWISTRGLTAEWITMCLAAGLTRVEDAIELDAAARQDPRLARRIRELAARRPRGTGTMALERPAVRRPYRVAVRLGRGSRPERI